MKILISVIDSVEGVSLTVGNKSGGRRVAGSKPWGGGSVIHEFECDVGEVVDATNLHKFSIDEESVK